MKTKLSTIGLITIATAFAAIAIALIACDDGTTPKGTAPTITTTTLPDGTAGTPYSQTLTATGDTPITWTLNTGSSLPAGLSLAETGVISGTPTTAATSAFTVQASNAAGSGTKELSIVINPQPLAFVAVTSITDVPATGTTNEELTLTGTVNPSTATNTTITWTIKDQDGTNSTLNENKLTAANSGTVKVTATITNGKTETTDYTEDFDITINQFQGNTYTVTFNLAGGNINGSTDNVVKTVNEGSDATAPANPTKTGYTFSGWDKAFTNVTENLTVKAQYTADSPTTPTYTVVYNKNADDVSGTTASSTHEVGKEQALTEVGFKREGYIFVCWNTKADGTGTDYYNKQSVTNLTTTASETVNLYAKWVNGNMLYGVAFASDIPYFKESDQEAFYDAIIANQLKPATINKSTGITSPNPGGTTGMIRIQGTGCPVVILPSSFGEPTAIVDVDGVAVTFNKTLNVVFNGIGYHMYDRSTGTVNYELKVKYD